MRGGLMVVGTASDVGKTEVVTGLCRLLARRGVRVAPFKAQNMSNNSFVTIDGREMGRAQAVQALAAGAEPEVAMNPVLLKPSSDRRSQVVVMGVATEELSAREYQARKAALLGPALEALADLRRRFDVVVCEGAGGAAEINLLSTDITNLRVAVAAGLPAVVVGDIDRGGVFAALYGTVALLPEDQRRLVRGFVINKMRGDPSLLGSGMADLEERCGVPTLGVLPWVDGISFDSEDSLALEHRSPSLGGGDAAMDVALIRLPRISNFTDVDPLALEADVRVVRSAAALGDPDLIVVPGSKATVSDLEWLRASGLVQAMAECRRRGTTVLGVCAGYQMLGHRIEDPDHVESPVGTVEGLGWLGATTNFEAGKVTRQRVGRALGRRVTGYQIHHGRTRAEEGWIELEGGELDGAEADGVLGTSLHGLFEEDGFRAAFLAAVAERREKEWKDAGVSFAAARGERFDRLADLLEEHLDVERLLGIASEALWEAEHI